MPELRVGERHWSVAAGSNLLDALNQNGVPVPYSCRAGSCHACLVQCVRGLPSDSRPDALSAQQREQGWRLASRELDTMEPDVVHGLALIDLDHFKRINDVHGHAAGDQVLQAFAGVASACLREGDVLARYGGEEFVVLLPDCSPERLTACCERLRIAFTDVQLIGLTVGNLSLSGGMTLLMPGDDLDDALQRADQALYRAKRDGRNRCAAAWENVDA